MLVLVLPLAFHLGCAQLEQLSLNNTSQVWMEAELPKVENLQKVAGHRSEITHIFPLPIRPGAPRWGALTVSRSGEVLLWDITAGQAYQALQLQPGVSVAAFRPDKLLLAVGFDSAVKLYSVAAARELAALSKIRARVTSLDFSPGGSGSLLLGAADGKVYQWRYERLLDGASEGLFGAGQSGQLEGYVGHGSVVSAVAYHPYGRVFFSGDWEGALNAWLRYEYDPKAQADDHNLFGARFFGGESVRIAAPRDNSWGVDHLVVSSDGSMIVTASQNGALEVWQVRGFRKIASVQAHSGVILTVAVAPDGRHVATVARDGNLKIWKLQLDAAPESGISVGSITLARETPLPQVRALSFIGAATLLGGDTSGQLFQISLQGDVE